MSNQDKQKHIKIIDYEDDECVVTSDPIRAASKSVADFLSNIKMNISKSQ